MAAAAAAYAALVSLFHILHQILRPPPTHHFTVPREQIQYLQEQVSSLIDFFVKYSSRSSHEIEDLESRIVAAVYEAEDIIESYVVAEIQEKYSIHQKMEKDEALSIPRVLKKEYILEVAEKLASIGGELGEIKKRNDVERVGLGNTKEAASSSRSLPGDDKNIMVGFDERLDEIRTALASDDTKRLIVPIVGMGGIGKTTLAANVYNDAYIVENFMIRAWVSVSQEFMEREIIIALLQQIDSKIEVSELSADQLGLLLYKELFGRKYLIVLHDMWEFNAWEKLRKYLPDRGDGSRILVTTRMLNLATDFGSCSPYEMRVLDKDRSWDLIYEYVKDDCPAELEEIGRSIATGCGGLPLALVVIGGLLARSEKTRDFWEYVNENVTSTANCANDEQCLKILRLSYGELPVHLKPCFLYLAVFPKKFEIRKSRLIRLWVSEGFIMPSTTGKTLEEVAEGYLKDLVDSNLVMISKMGHSGKVSKCNIHDVIRDLCTTEAEKNKFLCIAKLDDNNSSPELENERRLSIHTGAAKEKLYGDLRPGTHNRSFLTYSAWESRRRVARRLNLLRVLDVVGSHSMDEIIWLINSRYITCTIPRESRVSSFISVLWNLQTLISTNPISLPPEFWLMPQLRHLKMPGITLADPPEAQVILENLQTLTTVRDFIFSKNVLERIPNLIKLGIDCEATAEIESFGLSNIASLHKLESLVLKSRGTWKNMAFPDSLTKLTLSYCQIPWEEMSVVGSLPNLAVLKLRKRAATGKEWKPNEEGFRRLKFLMIDWCQLEIWEADNSHFPVLERIQLIGVRMEEFPKYFAEIEALRTIDLNYCSRSLFLSAKKMSEDREDYGYEDIQIRSFPSEASGSREKVVVGREDDVETLKGYLLEEAEELDVISIIGMPGLGKTTLAKKIFRDPVIQHEFPIRIWVDIPQIFSVRNVLLSILREFTVLTEDAYNIEEEEIAQSVAGYLASVNFLLVMDDVWSSDCWDSLQIAFPQKGKVLITSRQSDICRHTNRRRGPHELRFLTPEDSVKLLGLEVFGKPEFPPELEIGAERIADQCLGLPLVIEVIGGILANKLSESDEMITWEKAFQQVFESFRTCIDAGVRLDKIISLCYEQLPYHLKKCFLYVGMFPFGFQIPTSKLIRLWIAEGFIQREDNISLEETAEKYLDDLFNSNLLIADKMKADGKVKTCRVHDMLSAFCRIQAKNERGNFFKKIETSRLGFTTPFSEEHKYQRLCIHSNGWKFLSGKPYCPSVHSFVCFSEEEFVVQPEHISAIAAGFKQLQVLDITPFKITLLPSDTYHLLHLRYFALSFDSAVLPADFSRFRNLQTLVVDTTSPTLDIKADIFNMIELRHFKTNASAALPKPGASSEGGENIQTLRMISPESCSEEVFDRAPNLKKLGIRGKLHLLLDDKNRSFDSLGKLENLEKLKLINDAFPLPPSESQLRFLPRADKFPIKLRSLTLCATYLSWSLMSVLESLENLEVLKLKDGAFVGDSWNVTNGGFPHLEFLHIGDTDLSVWKASHDHFPRLKSLDLSDCGNLLEVPIGLADAPNFQQLNLYFCGSAVASAKKIQEAKERQQAHQVGNVHGFSLSIYPPLK